MPHLLIFFLFAFPFAGAVDKLVLPDSMESVDFSGCNGLTGTAVSRMGGFLYLFNTFWLPAAARPYSHFLVFFLLPFSLSLPRRSLWHRGYRPVEPSRGHEGPEPCWDGGDG